MLIFFNNEVSKYQYFIFTIAIFRISINRTSTFSLSILQISIFKVSISLTPAKASSQANQSTIARSHDRSHVLWLCVDTDTRSAEFLGNKWDPPGEKKPYLVILTPPHPQHLTSQRMERGRAQTGQSPLTCFAHPTHSVQHYWHVNGPRSRGVCWEEHASPKPIVLNIHDEIYLDTRQLSTSI